MKRWPDSGSRREAILLTHGIDRAHRERNALLNLDVNSASDVAQRTGTVIQTIYALGGHWRRNFWEATYGENGLAKLSSVTGGESFFVGLGTPAVSFKPYLDQLQNILDNQYLLSFTVKPEKKAGLQPVTISTEIAGVDLNATEEVWVPAAK